MVPGSSLEQHDGWYEVNPVAVGAGGRLMVRSTGRLLSQVVLPLTLGPLLQLLTSPLPAIRKFIRIFRKGLQHEVPAGTPFSFLNL
jgi:hypothetical protein